MSNALPKMEIDGKWVPCLPAEEYGFLGTRYLCELGKSPTQPSKKLLIRELACGPTGAAPESASGQLTLNRVGDGPALGLRPAAGKTYRKAAPAMGGKYQTESCSVIQQDITGLISLKRAVMRAVKEGEVNRIWTLFYRACKTLDDFSNAVGPSGQLVPLQCPSSLAVSAKDRVIPLDAEVRLAPGRGKSEATPAYATWFGAEGRNGFANVRDASVLHARALLLYFRQLLADLRQHAAPASQPKLAQMAVQLGHVSPDAPLEQILHWMRNDNEDWHIPLDEEELELVVMESTGPTSSPTGQPKKRRSLLLRMSLWLNFLLATAITILILLWQNGTMGKTLIPEENSTLLFSSYAVVFPTQGTISEKVDASLNDLFSGKVVEIKRTPQEQEKLLGEKMQESIRSIEKPDKLKQLLTRLTTEHAIRFKGFTVGESSENLAGMIERGGIYTITGGPREQHGSLLQSNSLEKILGHAKLTDDKQARELLIGLKQAIADYASLKDALSIVGDRPAFILRVDPTGPGHEEMRRKLLSRLDKPVFISRPIPELFDAVDPTADTGRGSAAYSLRLDRKCFWRLAGLDDRKNVDFANNSSNDRMKWKGFDAGQLISWKPIPLTRKNGKTEAVATFDIAVALPRKVVVFRNQSILVGESKQQVMMQARSYIDKVLRLQVEGIEDAVSVQKPDEQFTGALSYSYLAEQVKNVSVNQDRDLQLLDPKEFENIRTKEDAF